MKSLLVRLALLALCAPATFAAPARLEVGDASVAGAALKPYTNLWKFTQEKPGGPAVDAGPEKKADTWVVETPTKLYGKMTWWVTKEPPYVIKAVLEIPKKEDGSREIAAIVRYSMV